MTQTNDPPLISSLELIPDAAEKADLDAPNTSGGKLVIGQAPNITITETTVVADAAERLGLDVQEGDIAIQTNVSTSFIFTGGDNVANNWQTLDFDAVGAIDGEDINPRDITPRDITASGEISLQNLTVAGAINGADTSAAGSGEALTSDGSGGFSFASVGGADPLTFDETNLSNFVTNVSDLQNLFTQPVLTTAVIDSKTAIEDITASATAMQEVTNSPIAMQAVAGSQTAMQEVIATPSAIQEVTGSQTAMQEVAASQAAMFAVAGSRSAMQEVASSQTAMQQVAASQAAMRQIGLSRTARTEILNSNTAVTVLNNASTSFNASFSRDQSRVIREVIPQTNETYPVYIKSANYTGSTNTCIGGAQWYNRDDDGLSKSINEVFVDLLILGWNDGGCGSFNRQLSGDIEAVIF